MGQARRFFYNTHNILRHLRLEIRPVGVPTLPGRVPSAALRPVGLALAGASEWTLQLRCLNLLEQVAQFVCLCSDSFCRCLSISCCNLNIRDQANIDYVSWNYALLSRWCPTCNPWKSYHHSSHKDQAAEIPNWAILNLLIRDSNSQAPTATVQQVGFSCCILGWGASICWILEWNACPMNYSPSARQVHEHWIGLQTSEIRFRRSCSNVKSWGHEATWEQEKMWGVWSKSN